MLALLIIRIPADHYLLHDDYMEVAIIGGAVALIVAVIGAFTTLRAKKLDLEGQSEERRSADLKRGYDCVLAATDLMWHYRCHAVLKEYSGDPPFDWDEEWPKIQTRTNALFTKGVDLLKENSPNYHHISAALAISTYIVADGYTLKMRESLPDDYQQARDLILLCSRVDSRANKPISERYWKKLHRENRPEDPLTPEDQLSHLSAVSRSNQADGFIMQGDGVIAYLDRFQTWPRTFTPSLVITLDRIEDWKKRGIIDCSMPCFELAGPCHKDASQRISDKDSDHD